MSRAWKGVCLGEKVDSAVTGQGPSASPSSQDSSGHVLNIEGVRELQKPGGQGSHRTPNRPSTNCLGEHWELAHAKKETQVNQKQATIGQLGLTKGKRPVGGTQGPPPSW